MKKRKFPFIKCCEWLYQGALSAGILFVLYGFLQNELSDVEVFPKSGWFTALIAAVVFISQLLLIWSGEKGYQLQAGTGLLVANAAAGLFFIQPSQAENRVAFWCCVGLEAACVAAAVIVYVVRRFPVLMNLLVLAEAASLAVLAVLKKPLPGWCVGIMLTAFLLFLVELTSKGRKESLGLLPLFAATLVLMCFIPKNEKPMDWSWVKKAYTAVQEKAEMLSVDISYMLNGENIFPFSFAGYGNSRGLGGAVIDSDRQQLHVVGSGTKNPLYLTGNVYDVYTGDEWQISPNMTEMNPRLEHDSMLKALGRSIYAGEQDKLTSSCLLSVEYRFVKTDDFFHELNTTNLYGDLPLFRNDSPWTMKIPHGKDFTYQLRFLEFNGQSDEIKALMRQQAWKENTAWDDETQRREAEIYKTCTVLPDSTPQRIYDLANTITAGADNDYDKMTALADYLKTYTYTKSPPDCPEEQDFIDYFLFDSKSGYCTYFATALAVLGRCEGIPTRYVQGFMTSDTCKNTRSDVMITGNQAHAWTEVYIEHVGWVRFDATPGYGMTQPDRWKPIESSGIGQTENPYANMDVPKEKLGQEPQKPVKPPQWYVFTALKTAAAILAGCLLAAAIVWLRNALRRKKYSRMDDLGKVRHHIKRLLRLGKLRGAPMSEDETLEAYRERINGILDTEDYSFAEVCALYESIRFGGKTASPAELHGLESYAVMTERGYLADCGFLKKIIYFIL